MIDRCAHHSASAGHSPRDVSKINMQIAHRDTGAFACAYLRRCRANMDLRFERIAIYLHGSGEAARSLHRDAAGTCSNGGVRCRRSGTRPLALLHRVRWWRLRRTPALADEGGVSFWVPGLFGSLAATPQTPGFSFATIYYHTSVKAGADVAFARQVSRGNITVPFTGQRGHQSQGQGRPRPCRSELRLRREDLRCAGVRLAVDPVRPLASRSRWNAHRTAARSASRCPAAEAIR